MLMHQLLLRGMLVGILAGLLAFGFAKIFGEPSVDRSIAFEAAQAHSENVHSEHVHADHGHANGEAHEHEHEQPEPEIFSREIQSSIGLLTGVTVYGGALGGLFALVFALCYGRFGRLSPRACAALIALLGFIAVYAVPYLKYPANPPAVGEADTIGLRTGLYFSMIAISIIAMLAAFSLARLSEARLGRWNAMIVGGIAFVVLIGVAQAALPAINEVPATFPAATLWQFRLASLGIQAVLWSVIGLLFGALTERSVRQV